MTPEEKRNLQERMLEKAREFLDLVRDYIPQHPESHASMTVWPDFVSVKIYTGAGIEPEGDRCLVDAWADPRKTPMEVHTP